MKVPESEETVKMLSRFSGAQRQVLASTECGSVSLSIRCEAVGLGGVVDFASVRDHVLNEIDGEIPVRPSSFGPSLRMKRSNHRSCPDRFR